MANRIQAKNAEVVVQQFERGSQGALNVVGTITATVYVAKVHAPVMQGGFCTSRIVGEVEYFFINYAGRRIEVTPPNVHTTPHWQHGWEIALPGGFEHPLKAVQAQAQDAARRLGGRAA